MFQVSAERIFEQMLEAICGDTVFQCVQESKLLRMQRQRIVHEITEVAETKKRLLIIHRIFKYLCSLVKGKAEAKEQVIYVAIFNFFHKFLNRFAESLEDLPSIIFEVLRNDLCKAILHVWTQQCFILNSYDFFRE